MRDAAPWVGSARRSLVRLFPGRAVSPAMVAYPAWQNGLPGHGAPGPERCVACP